VVNKVYLGGIIAFGARDAVIGNFIDGGDR
jgi:hypothetical protein